MQTMLVLNAAARLVVKKRKCDSIAPTIRDNLHWLLVRQRVDFKICLLVYKCLHQARRSVPRVDDHSGFGSLYTSPFELGRSRRPACAADQNCWLRPTKLLSRWSVSVEQSVAGNKDDITYILAVLLSAENGYVLTQQLRVSAAVIIPSLQLGTGKTAAVRVSGPLVGKSCRVSRICPPSVGPAALSIDARRQLRYVAQLL